MNISFTIVFIHFFYSSFCKIYVYRHLSIQFFMQVIFIRFVGWVFKKTTLFVTINGDIRVLVFFLLLLQCHWRDSIYFLQNEQILQHEVQEVQKAQEA